jgi:hypothetical protein
MKDKYYVPDLTEFRVGFRYERMNGERWEEAVITVNDLSSTSNYYKDEYFENEFEEILKGIRTVRVAYLCEEDIVSLGFVQISFYSFEQTFGNTNVIIHYTHYKKTPYVQIFAVFEGNQSVRFSGQIKNINELEVILKQVGI